MGANVEHRLPFWMKLGSSCLGPPNLPKQPLVWGNVSESLSAVLGASSQLEAVGNRSSQPSILRLSRLPFYLITSQFNTENNDVFVIIRFPGSQLFLYTLTLLTLQSRNKPFLGIESQGSQKLMSLLVEKGQEMTISGALVWGEQNQAGRELRDGRGDLSFTMRGGGRKRKEESDSYSLTEHLQRPINGVRGLGIHHQRWGLSVHVCLCNPKVAFCGVTNHVLL